MSSIKFTKLSAAALLAYTGLGLAQVDDLKCSMSSDFPRYRLPNDLYSEKDLDNLHCPRMDSTGLRYRCSVLHIDYGFISACHAEPTNSTDINTSKIIGPGKLIGDAYWQTELVVKPYILVPGHDVINISMPEPPANKASGLVERSPQCYGGSCPAETSIYVPPVELSTIYAPPAETSTTVYGPQETSTITSTTLITVGCPESDCPTATETSIYGPPEETFTVTSIYGPPEETFTVTSIYGPPEETSIYGPPEETFTVTSTDLITVGCSAPGYATDQACPTSASGTASFTGTDTATITESATATITSGAVFLIPGISGPTTIATGVSGASRRAFPGQSLLAILGFILLI